jgi:hypothetical protein
LLVIYLLGLLVEWIGHALIPAALLLAGGSVVLLVVWLSVLRPRRLPVWKGWVALGLVAVVFGGWRTWEVWHNFSRPEFHMFRTYIADPIPKEVEGLGPGSPAPVMFHDGAYIHFHAPPELVEHILNHSLAGSKTLGVVAEMKRQSGRDTSDRVAVVAPNGQSYVKVDLTWVAKESSTESSWARAEVENFLKTQKGNAYVLLLSGDWGKFVSVLKYEPAVSNVVILQNLERRR